MKVVVVLFMAYNQPCQEVFLNKSFEEIHEILMDICPTYLVIGIMNYTDFEHLIIETLNDFYRPEHREYKQQIEAKK